MLTIIHRRQVKIRFYINLVAYMLCLSWPSYRTIAQELMPPKVSILESQVSTTTPIEGDTFRYSLKFDYVEDSMVYPVQHFEEQGFTIVETRSLEPQLFEERIIQQHGYTLTAPVGEYNFNPVTLQYPTLNSIPLRFRPTPFR